MRGVNNAGTINISNSINNVRLTSVDSHLDVVNTNTIQVTHDNLANSRSCDVTNTRREYEVLDDNGYSVPVYRKYGN